MCVLSVYAQRVISVWVKVKTNKTLQIKKTPLITAHNPDGKCRYKGGHIETCYNCKINFFAVLLFNFLKNLRGFSECLACRAAHVKGFSKNSQKKIFAAHHMHAKTTGRSQKNRRYATLPHSMTLYNTFF